jgi:hypothetical protein
MAKPIGAACGDGLAHGRSRMVWFAPVCASLRQFARPDAPEISKSLDCKVLAIRKAFFATKASLRPVGLSVVSPGPPEGALGSGVFVRSPAGATVTIERYGRP